MPWANNYFHFLNTLITLGYLSAVTINEARTSSPYSRVSRVVANLVSNFQVEIRAASSPMSENNLVVVVKNKFFLFLQPAFKMMLYFQKDGNTHIQLILLILGIHDCTLQVYTNLLRWDCYNFPWCLWMLDCSCSTTRKYKCCSLPFINCSSFQSFAAPTILVRSSTFFSNGLSLPHSTLGNNSAYTTIEAA